MPISGGSNTKLADVENYTAIDLAIYKDTVFWTELPNLTYYGGPLKAIPKTGGAVTVVYQDNRSTPCMLTASSDYIFWTEGGRDTHDIRFYAGLARIAKMPISGGIPITLASGISTDAPPITADDINVYVADGYAIKKFSINDGTVERLATTLSKIIGIGTDGINIYWRTGGSIYRVPVNGGVVSSLSDDPVNSGAVNSLSSDNSNSNFKFFYDDLHRIDFWVVNGYVYWISGWTIARAPTSGGPTQTILAENITQGLPTIRYFVVDGNYVYYSEIGGNIKKISVNGGVPTLIIAGGQGDSVLAVDDQALYWLNFFELAKIAIDSTNRVHMTDWLSDPDQTLALGDNAVYFTDCDYGHGGIVKVTPK